VRRASLGAGASVFVWMAVINADVTRAAAIQTTCGRIADIPELKVAFGSTPRTPLRLAEDLLESFSRGEGELLRTSAARRPDRPQGLRLDALPWRIDEGRRDHARLVVWRDKQGHNDDNMRAMVLGAGESWCSPEYGFPPGSRLRFEALSIENGVGSNLSVSLQRSDAVAELLETTPPFPGGFTAGGQTDLALDPRPARICFRAGRAATAIGEARILAPEPRGSDTRPRWLVLTIQDGLRGDVLRQSVEEQRRVVPALSALARGGHNFKRAISPGCHTRAAVWPVLMGRDLMRIDPLMRRQSQPTYAPLTDVYSRANLFVTHLAETAGYRSVFLGNNAYFRSTPAFGRLSSWGTTDFGTLDTIRALPDLFARYGDERLLLVYYITAPHEGAQTPRRLFEAFGCADLTGIDQCRCAYRARVRHADEALEQLQKGLAAAGLSMDTLQVTTADHGDLYGDGMALEGEIRTGRELGDIAPYFESFQRSHGRGCHAGESDVPLVVHGRGIEPSVTAEPVSSLDIVPTLLEVLKVRASWRLDGVRLPLSSGAPSARRSFVSHGYCSDSVISGSEQLIWWVQGCRIRETESKAPLTHRSELWSGGKRIATDRSEPTRLTMAMEEHEAWLKGRLPGEAMVFGVDQGFGHATLTLEVEGGVISDFGPASTVAGLDRIALGTVEARRLSVSFHKYEGLYYIATSPARARVRISLEIDGKPANPLTLVGPMQIPLSIAGRWVDPGERPHFFVSSGAPPQRAAGQPALRLWWQPNGAPGWGAGAPVLSEFDRVLREWGYIR
jgi:Sulfatase